VVASSSSPAAGPLLGSTITISIGMSTTISITLIQISTTISTTNGSTVTTEQHDDFVTCTGCGRFVLAAEMLERDADATPYEEVDVSDIEGVKDAQVRTVRIEYRCPRCVAGEPEQEIVQ
jgi:hypothetical protein